MTRGVLFTILPYISFLLPTIAFTLDFVYLLYWEVETTHFSVFNNTYYSYTQTIYRWGEEGCSDKDRRYRSGKIWHPFSYLPVLSGAMPSKARVDARPSNPIDKFGCMYMDRSPTVVGWREFFHC